MSKKERIVARPEPGLLRTIAEEDGNRYRGHIQDLGAVMGHVKDTNEKVNGNADSKRNVNGWRYGGSIPTVFLIEWLGKTGYTMDLFAREKRVRQEFIKWMQDRDRRAFIADDGHLRPTRIGVGNGAGSSNIQGPKGRDKVVPE